jgi:hypothetical protein
MSSRLKNVSNRLDRGIVTEAMYFGPSHLTNSPRSRISAVSSIRPFDSWWWKVKYWAISSLVSELSGCKQAVIVKLIN